jgi:AraC-like DNA-binding protein
MATRPTPITIPNHTFAIAQEFADLDTGWRTFPGHYLLYAASGAFQLELPDLRWFLPPQRAAWVRADQRIALKTRGAVTCNSVLFAHSTIPQLDFSCRVFQVTPLAREMIRYTMRWGIDRFFLTLADVCRELAAHPDQVWLPQPRSAELCQAMDYVLQDLSRTLRLSDAAKAAGVSERTLVRRFLEETQMSWRQFVGRARMIEAMSLLSQGALPIIEVAYAVGFESAGAFSTAFRRFTGTNPSAFQQGL